MAEKNYPTTLHENSELRLILEAWLGKEWVAGIKNSSQKKPFRNIELVLPPGRSVAKTGTIEAEPQTSPHQPSI